MLDSGKARRLRELKTKNIIMLGNKLWIDLILEHLKTSNRCAQNEPLWNLTANPGSCSPVVVRKDLSYSFLLLRILSCFFSLFLSKCKSPASTGMKDFRGVGRRQWHFSLFSPWPCVCGAYWSWVKVLEQSSVPRAVLWLLPVTLGLFKAVFLDWFNKLYQNTHTVSLYI